MIYDAQDIAHPRGFGLACHLGLWFDLPSIGCAKTPLLMEFIFPGASKGSFEFIRRDGKDVGAVRSFEERFIHGRLLLITFQIALQAVHSFLDVLQGIGIRKSKVPLGICPKIDARCHSNLCLLQDVKGELIGIV